MLVDESSMTGESDPVGSKLSSLRFMSFEFHGTSIHRWMLKPHA